MILTYETSPGSLVSYHQTTPVSSREKCTTDGDGTLKEKNENALFQCDFFFLCSWVNGGQHDLSNFYSSTTVANNLRHWKWNYEKESIVRAASTRFPAATHVEKREKITLHRCVSCLSRRQNNSSLLPPDTIGCPSINMHVSMPHLFVPNLAAIHLVICTLSPVKRLRRTISVGVRALFSLVSTRFVLPLSKLDYCLRCHCQRIATLPVGKTWAPVAARSGMRPDDVSAPSER